MPRIDVTFTAGAIAADAQRELAPRIAEAMLRWEGAPDAPFFREIAWVHLHELDEGGAYTADGPAERSQFIVDVMVPAGALNERRRAGLIDEFTSLVREAAGLGDDDLLRVWVIVHEVPDGFWGAGGQIVRFEQLARAAQAEREQAGTAAI
jgi:phenylpyruvate tautomerase PptA (4-oxalocrotonate tautomerase family)